MNPHLKKQLALNWNQARALIYTVESLPLPLIHRLINGGKSYTPMPTETAALIRIGKELLEVDAEDFSQGVFPRDVFSIESPRRHFQRLVKLFADSVSSSFRQKHKKTKEFSKEADSRESLPDYYRRNFHFQTDGYLSDRSAELYEHQVELLFRGMADPMRRRLLRPMKKALESRLRLKILELGCGTGTFTKSLASVFPEAHITAIDLSPSYIKKANAQMIRNKNVHFLTGDAQHLPFKDSQFDAVVSVFLHHELPPKVRQDVINESFRVLKKSGFWGLVDSLQIGDISELDWALREFPKTFHEPFYKSYVTHPLEAMVERVPGFSGEFTEKHFFFSKLLFHQGNSELRQ